MESADVDVLYDEHVDAFESQLAEARRASQDLAVAGTALRHSAILAIADAIEAASDAIVAANAEDIARGTGVLDESLLDRLRLNPERIAALASAARDLATLPDPVGEVLQERTLPNGLELRQVRVPFGVVGAIYEARPNVTVDLACIALGSGNAIVLRGGSAAEQSNAALVATMQRALASVGLPVGAIQTIDAFGRDGANRLMKARGAIDLLVPRGSAGLIQTVVEESTVPVIETGAGIVHAFVDRSVDLDAALPLLVNAKAQRVSVCNSLETILIHKDIAEVALGPIVDAMRQASVTVHSDGDVQGAVPLASTGWATEHLSLDVAIRIVDDLDAAIAHINTFGTHHTDVILTTDEAAAERFLAAVDSAVVMVNASTRFTDGGEFGFGAEVGISTQKSHARGPMGLPELTSSKWLVRGDWHVRA